MSGSSQRPVILVDDNPDDLVFLRRRIDKAGIRNPVVTFVSSEEALDYLQAAARSKATRPDLVPCVLFIDIKMPKLNGFELLKFVRGRKELWDLRVVILSGSDEPKDKALGMVLGASCYLVKFPSAQVIADIISGTPTPRRT